MINVKKLGLGKRVSLVKELYYRAFPENERLSFGLLRVISLLPQNYFYALYDDGKFIGMLYYVTNKDNLLGCYFAIDDTIRSNGYGTKALEWLKNQKNNIYVIMESADVDCNNKEQRVSRQGFYRRNGFSDTGYWYVDYYNEYYDILSTNKNFDVESYRRLGKRFTFWDRKLNIVKK